MIVKEFVLHAVLNGLMLGLCLRGYAALLDTNETLDDLWARLMLLPQWAQNILKPLILCPTCMSSFWGLVWMLSFTSMPAWYWPILAFTSAGFVHYNR
jgi:hypothetical protein